MAYDDIYRSDWFFLSRRLGPFWLPTMLGEPEHKWREDGHEETWYVRGQPGPGRRLVTTRPEYAWKLFSNNRHTGQEKLESLKVSLNR